MTPNALNRDDTVHGTYYYLASEADKIIDELRAEIDRLNSGWYDKLLAATLERDAEIERLKKADAAWVAANCGAGWINELRDHAKLYLAQRKVLEQALDFIKTTNKSSQFLLVPASNLNKAITAIEGVLE